MKAKYLKNEEIKDFIRFLLTKYQVFAPVKEGKVAVFKEISSPDKVFLKYRNSKKAPKEFFFPQTEKLLEYQGPPSSIEITKTEFPVGKRLIFGMRPCDVNAVLILDRLFINQDYVDNYYKDKRDNTVIIGYSCNYPCSTCFCTAMGGGPFKFDGADILLTDLENGFLAEPITDIGEELLKNFNEASEKELNKKMELEKRALKSLTTTLPLEGIPEKLKAIFDDPIWETLAENCIGCGTCTYLCPTCHCFDIQDETRDNKGHRLRNWDSCMFPLFTFHGSGHQPRDKHFQRVRQRIQHKFSYYPMNFGVIACVGCGRCLAYCPANVDIRKIIKTLAEVQLVKGE